MKYLHNWIYNRKNIPLTAEEATDLPNTSPQHSPSQFWSGVWHWKRHVTVSGVTLGWEEGIPHPWTSTDSQKRNCSPPGPSRKETTASSESSFPHQGVCLSRQNSWKRLQELEKTTGKKGVDLCTSVQAQPLPRMYWKTEGYPQEVDSHPMPPVHTDMQPCCSIHSNHLRPTEDVRLEFQIKKETFKTKQKYIWVKIKRNHTHYSFCFKCFLTWWGSTRARAGSCTWGGTTPCTSTGSRKTCWRALCGEGPGCPGGWEVNHEPAVCPGCQEGQWDPGVR